MMCNEKFSESGQPCGFEPCEAYVKLKSENIVLLHQVTDDSAYISELKRDRNKEREENAALRQERDRLLDLAEYVASDALLGQLTRIFGSNQKELVELRKKLQEVRHG